MKNEPMSDAASRPAGEKEPHSPPRPPAPNQEPGGDERPQGDRQGPPGKKEEGE